MYMLGLTGSIAMGKSTVLGMFRDLDVPVFDADEEVRTLLRESTRLKNILKKTFPKAFSGGEIDRGKLADIAFRDETKLRALEAAIHPVVMKHMAKFIREHKTAADLIVLDIPLLYETGAEDICDGVAVVSAPNEEQRERALARPGMTEKRLDMILSRQLSDEEKRKRADFIIPTGEGLDKTRKAVNRLVQKLTSDSKKGGG